MLIWIVIGSPHDILSKKVYEMISNTHNEKIVSNITIVTAFFDIGRGNLPKEKHGRIIPEYQHRNNDKYLEYFSNLAKVKNDMIIYTTQEFEERILKIRNEYGNNNTKVVVLDSYVVDPKYNPKDRIQKIMDSHDFISNVETPENIEYWNADYVLVNLFKSFYVSHAVDNGYIDTSLAAWIDFGYCRNENTLGSKDIWNYDFDENKIHLFNIKDVNDNRPLSSIIYSGDVYIQGAQMIAGIKKWKKLKNLMQQSFDYLLSNNLSDDDQTILLMSYISSPEDFTLRPGNNEDWFRIFKDYNIGVNNE